MTKAEAHGLEGLLEVDPKTRRSLDDALKQPAGAARLSKFKEDLAHLAWADSLGPTAEWLEGGPPAKVANFAGETRVTDANDMRRMGRERGLPSSPASFTSPGSEPATRWPRCSANAWRPSPRRPRTSLSTSVSSSGRTRSG